MSEVQYSILLVDDDEVDRLMVKRALKKVNFPATITEASNGSEAIAQLKTRNSNIVNLKETKLTSFSQLSVRPKFDLILLDYLLPDIDGLHLIAEIKKLHVTFPIIVLTGQGDEEIAVEMMKAGAADYLAKGKIEPKSLAKSIGNAIRINKAEQAVELANQRLKASNELLVLKNKELEKQQQQIKLQNIQLQEAYQLKSQFLATMSHELRTPMNAIMGFSQLLMRQYPDPLSQQQQNLVERILNNSKNLLEMINELLDFSKIEAGKLEAKPQSLDLNYLIRLTVEELRSLAISKKLKLTHEIKLENPIIIQDQNFVKRTLINLLSNALKFTNSGQVIVQAEEIEPDKIALTVKDTGVGIAETDLDKIFRAFEQVDQSFTRQHSGTGLGLAITQSLVTMMGGKILVESKLGEGSTFTVEIPRKYDV